MTPALDPDACEVCGRAAPLRIWLRRHLCRRCLGGPDRGIDPDAAVVVERDGERLLRLLRCPVCGDAVNGGRGEHEAGRYVHDLSEHLFDAHFEEDFGLSRAPGDYQAKLGAGGEPA